ncbi:MAG: XRE family transcriptional regulator [Myxococcales bacterium]|nr:MAG: XRE family transcriptional regulator [Myxococcales bacterium]
MPADAGASALGAYLKDRRERLDPAVFGFSSSRRRTPGLRREEVAQRADVSTTWYTWLEQGRGGAPSADALDRLARALSLSDVEREHLYLLGRGHPPELPRSGVPAGGVTSQLQSVLDAIESRPALITTSTWDIVAWNAVTARVFLDYSTIPVDQRNSLRFLFAPGAREHMADWEHHARSLVALFRAGAARSSDVERVAALVDELSRSSPEFAAMWREHDVAAPGPGTKRLAGAGGEIVFDYAMFAVHGHADLHMIVYTPATPVDAARLRERLSARDGVEGGDAAGRQRE